MHLRQKVNMRQLRCFHAVAQEGSFTSAARALFVGQPSITTHVRGLERHFGVELFCRHGHNVELTDTGRALLAITQRIFSLENEAEEVMRAASGLKTGHLKIGSIGPHQATEMIVAFGRRYPDVDLSVSLGNSQEVRAGLLDFRSDVAILPEVENDPRFYSLPYSRNRVVLLVSPNHAWWKRKSVTIEELQGERMVLRELGSATRRVFEDALTAAGVTVRRVLEIESREAVREAVASDIGVGIALEEEAHDDGRTHTLQVSDAEIYLDPHVVCLQERREAPVIQAFFEVVEEMRPRANRKGRRSASGKTKSG
jgi:aminoethylphosphonate catabolism LysR family transcriptional regulator